MGVMDKFLQYMKLNPEEEVDDDYDYDEDYETELPQKVTKNTIPSNINDEDYDLKSSKKELQQKITPIRQTRKMNGAGMEVCVIKPISMEDAREITDTLLSNRTVVLNLEGLDVDIAQRIIDFTSGSCFAINGNLQKISHYIFIITPASVDISGDFQEIFAGTFDVPHVQK